MNGVKECNYSEAWLLTQIRNVTEEPELWESDFWLSNTTRAIVHVSLHCGGLGNTRPLPPQLFDLNNTLYNAASEYKLAVADCTDSLPTHSEDRLVDAIMHLSQAREYLGIAIDGLGTAMDAVQPNNTRVP